MRREKQIFILTQIIINFGQGQRRALSIRFSLILKGLGVIFRRTIKKKAIFHDIKPNSPITTILLYMH